MNLRNASERVKQFGIFVGLYNRTTGNNFTVQSALQDEKLVEMFKNTTASMQTLGSSFKKSKSTKRKSLDKLSMGFVDSKIFNFLKQNPHSTRNEVSNILDLRIQTVCGSVKRMLDAKLIYVAGQKIDKSSDREVETLAIMENK